ncbi:hypothetical protein B9Z55_006665 [Caenorhabditis nigoni]|uniref:Uncharacterized protein n=1 Tax=Caenorhabditis nigoni TaxID=1611254 RepID=A0A2G5V620_9PELO|nr:hypothetical protein B9Z55_006665 [Caenorhabditis nigoni]
MGRQTLFVIKRRGTCLLSLRHHIMMEPKIYGFRSWNDSYGEDVDRMDLFYDCSANLKFEKELEVAMTPENIKASPYYKDKVLSIPISEEAGEELWQHWTDQAFSGLISAIATRRLNLVEKYDKKKHEKCSAKAHNVASHAKCLVALEGDGLTNRLLKRKKYFDQKSRKRIEKKSRKLRKSSSEKLAKLRNMESYEASKSTENKTKKRRRRILRTTPEASTNANPTENDWMGSFRTVRRARRSIKQADSYILKSEHDRSPFSTIIKHLATTVKIVKKKEKLSKWQEIIQKIQNESKLMRKRKEVENLQKKRIQVFQEAKRMKSPDNSITKKQKHRDGSLLDFESIEKHIEDEELKEMIHQKSSNLTEEEKMMMVPIDLIRQAAKIGLGLTGQNTTSIGKKNLKLISPRFMSVLPEDKEANEIDILSPSLFALHDSGTGIEKKTSLKSLLGSAMDSADSQNFLDLLVEATGVAEAVEDAEQKLIDAQRKKDDAMGRGPDGQPLYFTKENITERFPSEAKKIELFEKLDKTYSMDQLKDMNQTGYTVLNPTQMQMMYGKKSPFKNSKLLKTYKNMTRAEIHLAIHRTIKDVADEKLKFEVRQKDIVLSPILATPIINNPVLTSQPLILSPAVMVPLIQSPAVFGAVILSPWLFVPVILSPRLLSPVVLTPFLFAPIVLSPLALVPVILAPGVFNPFILSPLVLCPFVLSPQVMTPLILSPFALTPLILTPLALSPIVLSPFVLSPQVMSPQFVTGIILSPYALSPAIESNGKLVTVFASPSWLS